MGLFWELLQQSQIGDAADEASDASGKAESAQNLVSELEQKLIRQSLASQAMWELVRERLDLTDHDLTERMVEIDLRDGEEDGKMARQIVQCPNCKRTSISSRTTCQNCGTELPGKHVFQ